MQIRNIRMGNMTKNIQVYLTEYRRTGGDADGVWDNIVGMGTKYFTASSSSPPEPMQVLAATSRSKSFPFGELSSQSGGNAAVQCRLATCTYKYTRPTWPSVTLWRLQYLRRPPRSASFNT